MNQYKPSKVAYLVVIGAINHMVVAKLCEDVPMFTKQIYAIDLMVIAFAIVLVLIKVKE